MSLGLSEIITVAKLASDVLGGSRERGGSQELETLEFSDKTRAMQKLDEPGEVKASEAISYEELNRILTEYKNPLAFYIFSNRLSYAKNIINTYSFGGGAINDILGQIVNKNLPFGGIGNSGIGKYHGYESFKTFSHFKPYIIKSNFFDLSFKYKMSQNSLLFRITKRLLKHISV